MAAAAGDASLRRLPPGTDVISTLPDEVLQSILGCLPSAAAAAQTSVLSRRWRRVWTSCRSLTFTVEQQILLSTNASTTDAVDAALAAYSAGGASLTCLNIGAGDRAPTSVPVARIAPWLRFASQRLAGELHLSAVPESLYSKSHVHEYYTLWRLANRHRQLSFSDLLHRAEMERGPHSLSLLELPACERATRIELTRLNFPLGFPQTGTFAELLVLRINKAKVLAGDVGRLVSTQCPCLRELEMTDVDGITASVISIHSTTLARIVFRRVNINKGVQLEVASPELLYLALDDCGDRSAAATISTPMLTQLIWNHVYDPSRHRIEEADRQIYRLVLTYGSKTSSSPLLGRFDSVDELCLHLSMPLGAKGYNKFVQEMDELPKATVLDVKGLSAKQHLGPAMLHLLGKCSRLKKLKIDISPPIPKETLCDCGCSCVPPEIWTTNDVELGSLEEVEISSFTGAKEEMEFLELLFSCKIKTRRIAIHTRSDASLSREKQRQIWALSRPCCIVLEFENTQFI